MTLKLCSINLMEFSDILILTYWNLKMSRASFFVVSQAIFYKLNNPKNS